MKHVTVTLDADLAIETMVLSGTRNPQEGVEPVVRDYLARGLRTEARTGDAPVRDRVYGRESEVPRYSA